MNKASFWFDSRNPGHYVFFVLALIILNVALWMVNIPHQAEIVSLRRPVIITDIVPEESVIKMGDPYRYTVHFQKTRDDCSNGRLVRHMWEIESGRFYKVEEIATVQAKASEEVVPIYLETPTMPLAENDLHLMRPGFWMIRSTISYDCPTPAGQDLKQRDTNFDTPVFEVVE